MSDRRRPGRCAPLHALLAARLDRLDTAERSALPWARCRRRLRAGSVHALSADHAGRARAGLRRLVERDLLPAEAGTDPGCCASATAWSARPPTRRWRRPRAPAARAARGLARGLGGGCPRPTPGSPSTWRPPVATSTRSAGAPAELLARAGRRLEAAARVARGAATCWARSASSTGRSPCSAPTGQGVALLPTLVSALRTRALAPRRGARGSGRLDERRAPPPGAGARRPSSASDSGSIATPSTSTSAAAVMVVEHATETFRGLGDGLGLARAAYLISDLTWITCDPLVPTATPSACSGDARRAGSGFDVATALIFMAWAWSRDLAPRRGLARYDVLAAHAAASRPPGRTCGAAGRPSVDGRRRIGAPPGRAEAGRGSPSCTSARSRRTSRCWRPSPRPWPATRRPRSGRCATPRRWSRSPATPGHLRVRPGRPRPGAAGPGAPARGRGGRGPLEAMLVPCDSEWVIKRTPPEQGWPPRRATRSADSTTRRGGGRSGLTGFPVCRRRPSGRWPSCSWPAGAGGAAVAAGAPWARRGERRCGGPSTTRRRFAALLGSA